MSEVLISICENNDQGNPSGFAHKFMFYKIYNEDDCFLSLQCRNLEGAELKTSGCLMKMYGQIIPCRRTGEWTGNMMWNEYRVQINFATGLLSLIQEKGDFDFDDAHSWIARAWRKGEVADPTWFGSMEDGVYPSILDPNQLKLF